MQMQLGTLRLGQSVQQVLIERMHYSVKVNGVEKAVPALVIEYHGHAFVVGAFSHHSAFGSNEIRFAGSVCGSEVEIGVYC